MTNRFIVCATSLLLIAACSAEKSEPVAESDASVVNQIADRYYAETLARSPETAYFAGVDLERHHGMRNNHPDSLRDEEQLVDNLLDELLNVDEQGLIGTPEWITFVYLKQALQASVARRICRIELWNVNQMGGWHSGYTQIARLQPIGTAEYRDQSLARWSKFAAFADQEIANLDAGLKQGFSAPKVVVQRVIDQVDGLLALEVDESPFFSPAARDEDESFATATRDIVENQINPALQAYRNYLATTYLPAARNDIAITANPDGEACYSASLFYYTTLERSGQEVFELGQRTVEGNKQSVIAMGQDAYGIDDFVEILAAAKSDPADSFSSADELLAFSKDMVKRAETEMPNWVNSMPSQPVEVVPFEKHEEGTGRSAHYNSPSADRPGEYRIPLHKPETQSRGNAEATAFHEAWPGHHLQVAFKQSVEGLHPATRLIWFSGPGEGWARYSEALAEEMGLYSTKSGPILRRAWPARGMVADPGLHLFGWSREQAVEFMMEAGRFPDSMGDDMVDRIAILPGQLTAYDSGGLEILALRHEAEQQLGDAFDLREFHDRVLENGTIPLGALRAHVERWIAEKSGQN